MKNQLKKNNTYGTPLNTSAITHSSDLNFDFDDDDDRQRKTSDAGSGGGVRFGLKAEEEEKKVVRIWHADDIYSEEKDFQRVTSFKSAIIQSQTTAKDVREFVSSRLKIKPENTNNFRIYVIHQQTKKLVKDDERLKQLIDNTEGEIKFAFLSNSQLEDANANGPVALEIANDSWEPKIGHLVTHRRLLNFDKFCSFSNLTFIISNIRVYSFRCFVEIRCPQILNFDSIIKKKKEKKSSIGPVLTVAFKDESFLTFPILTQILDYIYTDSIEYSNLSIPDILHILHAAMLIKIPSIVWSAEYYLLTHLGLHNVYLMLRTANELQLKTVKNFCINYAHSKWSEFAGNKAGLEVLGIDLFQDLTVTLQQRKEFSVSSMTDEPPSTFIEDMKKIYDQMLHPDGVVEFEIIDPNNVNNNSNNAANNKNSAPPPTEKINFHRALLAAHEEKFHLFFLEKKDHKPFHFPNVSPAAFKALLKFIYYGIVEIDVVGACEILENLIEKFDLPKYRSQLEDVLKKELTIDNVLRVLKLTYLPLNEGRVHLTTTLRNNCLELICENFAEIDIPSVRKMQPEIAFDLLDAMHSRKRNSKVRASRNPDKKKKIFDIQD